MSSIEEAAPLLKHDARTCSKSLLCKTCLGLIAALSIGLIAVLCLMATRGSWAGSAPFSATDTFDSVVRMRPLNYNPTAPASIVETVLKDAGGAGNDGYLAVVDNGAPHFHAEGSCTSLARTSATSSLAGCRYAVNGGPFQSYWSGGCIGPTISHGHVLSQDWNTTYASFGLTASGEWIIGHVSDVYHQQNVVEVITGFGWLVRNGVLVAPTGGPVAERTAIGIDANGKLLMLQVDGCERCPLTGGASGLTLQEMAQLLISKGALHAINLDGGGSSTTFSGGAVKNRPDCLELGFRCERPVTSVACVA